MSKIERITKDVTIPFLGGRLLESVEELDSVLIVYNWKTGGTSVSWSTMSNGELAYSVMAAQDTAAASMFEEE